ncbi:paired box protein 2 homolog [Ptychodera flava]|uniref:paired box protein 2 homolog n=1 Tax=Ptychodera flava TaxID=63121 RepID=UPI00396A5AA7
MWRYKATTYKIVRRFNETGDVLPAKVNQTPVNTKLTPNVLEYISYYKTVKPSMYAREIQQKLLEDGVCNVQSLPSRQTVDRAIREKLFMSRKKISRLPYEACTEENQQKQLDFVEEMSNFRPEQLHWFDEASVVRTEGNRRYGHSIVGTPAVEIQRYASNATYTINLLVSVFGVDHADIIEGPSNGYEMMNFFEEAVVQTHETGLPCLSPGDCVIMDNCPFHHARHVEPHLIELLRQRGVRLIYQPPYNPQYNVCEYCFRHMKSTLRENEQLTYNYTELAIANSITRLTPRICQNLAIEAGYV